MSDSHFVRDELLKPGSADRGEIEKSLFLGAIDALSLVNSFCEEFENSPGTPGQRIHECCCSLLEPEQRSSVGEGA